MNIKKGLSFVAFGFLIILVNLNLTLNGHTVNISPDFIGWLLLFFAHDKLGAYTEDKGYLKWTALILAILSGAFWVLELVGVDADITAFETVINIAAAAYMFILFSVLESVARDCGSEHESMIGMLKYINLALFVILTVMSMFAEKGISSNLYLGAFAVIGAAAVVAAVVTAVTLFRLKGEIDNVE